MGRLGTDEHLSDGTDVQVHLELRVVEESERGFLGDDKEMDDDENIEDKIPVY